MSTTELQTHLTPKTIVNCLFAECLNEGDLSVADQLVQQIGALPTIGSDRPAFEGLEPLLPKTRP
jgi:hypothetical protein